MNELKRIIQFADSSESSPMYLASVVSVVGSHYRRIGARLAFDSDGEVHGALGGSCLDSDLLERAKRLSADNHTELVEYNLDTESDTLWGLGLGCGGRVKILLERFDNSETLNYLQLVEERLISRKPITLVTVFSSSNNTIARAGERLVLLDSNNHHTNLTDQKTQERFLELARGVQQVERSAVVHETIGDFQVEALVEFIPPPLSLTVCGAGVDAIPLVTFANELGWYTTVTDHRETALISDKFPTADRLVQIEPSAIAKHIHNDSRSAVVILTHNFAIDLQLTRYLLASEIPYVGLLGARTRTAKLIERLREIDQRLTHADFQRLYSPVGLDLGGDTPEAIALAIVAEIQSVFSGRAGGSLRTQSVCSSELAPTDIENG